MGVTGKKIRGWEERSQNISSSLLQHLWPESSMTLVPARQLLCPDFSSRWILQNCFSPLALEDPEVTTASCCPLESSLNSIHTSITYAFIKTSYIKPLEQFCNLLGPSVIQIGSWFHFTGAECFHFIEAVFIFPVVFLEKEFLQYLNQFDLQMFDLHAAMPGIIQNKRRRRAILKVSFT